MKDLTAVANLSDTVNFGDIPVPLILVGLMVAIFQCFFGQRIFRTMVALVGFALFGFVGYHLGVTLMPHPIYVAYIGLAALGALGGYLAYRHYKVGVFVQGALAGGIIGFCIGLLIKWPALWSLSLAAVLGIVLGLVCIKLLNPAIVIATGISGGMHAGFSMAELSTMNGYIGLALGAALSAVGVVYQFVMLKRHHERMRARQLEKLQKEEAKKKKHQKGDGPIDLGAATNGTASPAASPESGTMPAEATVPMGAGDTAGTSGAATEATLPTDAPVSISEPPTAPVEAADVDDEMPELVNPTDSEEA